MGFHIIHIKSSFVISVPPISEIYQLSILQHDNLRQIVSRDFKCVFYDRRLSITR